jgi:hypothetical protein
MSTSTKSTPARPPSRTAVPAELFGGPCDGRTVEVPRSAAPKVISFTWPAVDMATVGPLDEDFRYRTEPMGRRGEHTYLFSLDRTAVGAIVYRYAGVRV